MNETNERSLFTLSASEAQIRLIEIFAGTGANSVYQVPVARALMLGEAAAQKASLEALQHAERRAATAPTSVLKTVEQLVGLYFDGTPARIDLLTWDREGFIHGWSISERGRAAPDAVAFPSTVHALAQALRALATPLADWCELLEQHAVGLEQLLDTSRTRALAIAAQRVAERPWWHRVLRKRAIAREMVSLGFTGKAAQGA